MVQQFHRADRSTALKGRHHDLCLALQQMGVQAHRMLLGIAAGERQQLGAAALRAVDTQHQVQPAVVSAPVQCRVHQLETGLGRRFVQPRPAGPHRRRQFARIDGQRLNVREVLVHGCHRGTHAKVAVGLEAGIESSRRRQGAMAHVVNQARDTPLEQLQAVQQGTDVHRARAARRTPCHRLQHEQVERRPGHGVGQQWRCRSACAR